MKEQVFEYEWEEPKDGCTYISARDLRHAIFNSDQFPLPLLLAPGAKPTKAENIMHETLLAVLNAIEATPKYTMQEGKLIKGKDDKHESV